MKKIWTDILFCLSIVIIMAFLFLSLLEYGREFGRAPVKNGPRQEITVDSNLSDHPAEFYKEVEP